METGTSSLQLFLVDWLSETVFEVVFPGKRGYLSVGSVCPSVWYFWAAENVFLLRAVVNVRLARFLYARHKLESSEREERTYIEKCVHKVRL